MSTGVLNRRANLEVLGFDGNNNTSSISVQVPTSVPQDWSILYIWMYSGYHYSVRNAIFGAIGFVNPLPPGGASILAKCNGTVSSSDIIQVSSVSVDATTNKLTVSLNKNCSYNRLVLLRLTLK